MHTFALKKSVPYNSITENFQTKQNIKKENKQIKRKIVVARTKTKLCRKLKHRERFIVKQKNAENCKHLKKYRSKAGNSIDHNMN